jgi:hypothetical protein
MRSTALVLCGALFIASVPLSSSAPAGPEDSLLLRSRAVPALKGIPCYNCVQSCLDRTKDPPFLTADGLTYQQCKERDGCVESCDRTDVPVGPRIYGTPCYDCFQSCYDQTKAPPFYTEDGLTYRQCKQRGGCAESCDRTDVPIGPRIYGTPCNDCVQSCYDQTLIFPFYTADGLTYRQCKQRGGCAESCRDVPAATI